MNSYAKIKEAQSSYTSTEKVIAKYILENAADVLKCSAQSLGEKTGTSAAAIIRFSKKLGYNKKIEFDKGGIIWKSKCVNWNC